MTGFTFFQNYFDAINDEENGLSEEEQGRLYNAIFAYMFWDEEPNLKGACRMAFNLIKPSLDRSKQNGKNKSKNEIETERKSNEMEQNGNKMESEKSPFFENKEREEEKEDICSIVHNACTREEAKAADGIELDDGSDKAAEYLSFMREHPTVSNDLTNPSLIATVDYSILAKKISESNFLQSRCSLSWLIHNYRKILNDTYKNFNSPFSPEAVLSGKGDLQLWREIVNARERSKEERGNYPLYRMVDDASKREMGELYKGLSPEIRAYFEPNSFLDLCRMADEELKFERSRFLKALGRIRTKLAQEAQNG